MLDPFCLGPDLRLLDHQPQLCSWPLAAAVWCVGENEQIGQKPVVLARDTLPLVNVVAAAAGFAVAVATFAAVEDGGADAVFVAGAVVTATVDSVVVVVIVVVVIAVVVVVVVAVVLRCC